MSDFTSNQRTSALLSELLASLPAENGQLIPTPAEPGVVNIDGISDNQGVQTGTVSNAGFTDDLTPTLSGNIGEAGAGTVIQFCLNTVLVGSAVVNSDGSWSFTPDQPLETNHEYIFQSVVQDPGSKQFLISLPYTVYTTGANGDIPASVTLDSVVDDVRGYNGFTGALKDGGLTNDAHPALSGHATAGAVVNIYDNGVLLGTTSAAADGTWKYTPSTALTDGTHNLEVTAVNATGESQPETFSIVVDTVVTKPVVDSATDNQGVITGNLAGGSLTDDSRPVLHGYAEPNSRVDVHVFGPNGKQLYYQTVQSDADGSWSYQPKAFTTQGTYSFGISSVDAAGNAWRDYGTKFSLKYVGSNQDDTTAPDAATNLALNDNAGSIKGEIHRQDRTDDNTPTLTGKAEAGTTVLVSDNGVVLGSTTVKADGSWSFTPSPVLQDGMHSITTVVKDAAGQSSTVSDAITFTVDTHIDAPVITGYQDDVGLSTGTVEYGGRTDDRDGVLSGHAEAGSVVRLTMWGPRGMRYSNVASTVTDHDGNWHIQLSEGSRVLGTLGRWTFQVTANDEVGNSAASSKFNVNYVSSNSDDITPPDAPTIADYTDNAGGSTGNQASGTVTDDTTPTLNGRAEAGCVVKIYEGSTLLGSTTASSSGSWHFTPSTRSEGNHTFTATATDAAGNVSGKSAGFVVKIDVPDTTAPDAPAIMYIHDDVGPETGNFAQNSFGSSTLVTDDTTPTLHGNAEANSVVKIFDGSTVIGSTTADGSGIWSFTPSARSEGNHTFTATATDAAGNVSGKSAGFVVNIDVPDNTAPGKPTISNYTDNVGSSQGNDGNGGTTDDTTPTLNGKAEAGSIVRIYEGSSVIGSTTASSSGSWSFTPSARSEGNHTFTATATDAAGNVSGKSAGFVVNIDVPDTTAPSVPEINTFSDNVGDIQINYPSNARQSTDDTTPTLNGHAEAGSIVKIYEGSSVIGSTTANSSGSWSFTPTARSEGKHTFTATATDAAGNISGKSAGFVVNIAQQDTTAPNAPSIMYIYDDVGPETGKFGQGSSGGSILDTDDTTPTLNGEAEANSVVKIYEGSSVIGSTTASSSGNWSFTTPARSEGKHAFTATATDAAGNTSGHSGNFVVNVGAPDYNFTETFNSQNQTLFSNSAVYHLQYFDVSVASRGNSYYSPGFNGKYYPVSKPASSTALVMGEGTSVTLSMKHALTDISFKIGDLTTGERLTVKYIDSHGSVIGTQIHTQAEGLLTTASFHAPAGEEIASVQLSFTNPQDINTTTIATYIWIDDITGHSSGISTHVLQMSTTYLEAHPPVIDDAMMHDVTLATLPESNQHGVVELHDGSQSTLQLTLNEILSEAHDNLFIQDGHKQLAVTGDAGDVVELKVEDLAHNAWQDAGQVTAGGVQYEVYQHASSNVELLVQQGVELHQVS